MGMIKFGAAAVFAGGNREPTDAELDAIIDRSRGATDGKGALAGGKQIDAATMEATGFENAPTATRSLFGKSFEVRCLPYSPRLLPARSGGVTLTFPTCFPLMPLLAGMTHPPHARARVARSVLVSVALGAKEREGHRREFSQAGQGRA